jgi:hypothetical protein
MNSHDLFTMLIAIHIGSGATGAVAFWVPVIARKGGERHRWWGRLFAVALLVTGLAATMMSLTTLSDPIGTHPHLVDHADFSDPALIQAIFGWMMLYLAILTINLVWYGWLCIANRGDHAKNRAWHNMALQALLLAASVNCAARGVAIGQPLMIGISTIGFATVATNLWFMMKTKPARLDWMREHVKAIVGAGISVYTAFFAFGAVRLMPELALAPGLWAVPLVTGLSIILWHWRKIARMTPARAGTPAE